tara:strand:- start:418 stop:1824 length:1407 start_codon:yes stop_codon:yes gene_type:complete
MTSEIRVNKITHTTGVGTITTSADGIVVSGIITANNFSGSVPASNLTGTVADARISTLTASKLSGALPAISAANLTNLPAANITGTLPAIDGSALTGINTAFANSSVNSSGIGTFSALVSDTPLSHRNFIINGNFTVSQRPDRPETAYSGSDGNAGGYGGPDRWRVNQSGSTTSFQRVLFTPGEERGGSETYGKFTATGNDFTWIEQRIEDVTQFSNKQITISFDAKHVTAKPSGGFNMRVVQNFGSSYSGGPTASNAVTQYIGGSTSAESFVTTTSWQRFTITTTTASISGKTIGNIPNSSYLSIIIGQGSDATAQAWELNITNVQVELGPVATPYEKISYNDELERCQRYYEKIAVDKPATSGTGRGFIFGTYTNTRYFGYIPFSKKKRTDTPSFTHRGLRMEALSLGSSAPITSIGYYMPTKGAGSLAEINSGGFGSGGTPYHVSWYRSSTSASDAPYLGIDAEL